MNANISHGLVAELTVHSPEKQSLAGVAFDWIVLGVVEADLEGNLSILDQETPSSVNGFSRMRDALPSAEEAFGWGVVSVAPQGTFDVLYNPFVAAAYPWLRGALQDAPESAEVKIGRFDGGETARSAIRLSVSFDENLPDYVKLSYHVDEAVLIDPARTETEHLRLLRVVDWACHRFNVVFGHFSYAHTGGATEVERYLRGPSRVPTRNTPLWRSKLRGYSWLMTISAPIVQSLGGIDSLTSTGVFTSVKPLPNGSLLLQATQLFQEYRGHQVAALHETFRDVVVQGEWRSLSPAPGQPSRHMVVFGQ
ncbi:hypothetical protein ACWGH4_20845 [Streptomyces sp. NPDC054847]